MNVCVGGDDVSNRDGGNVISMVLVLVFLNVVLVGVC